MKSKKAIYIIGVLILVSIVGVRTYFISMNSATATIENEVYSLQNVRTKK